MSQPALKHIVFLAGIGLTHVRPTLHFCVRLAAKFPNVFISVYTPGPLAAPAEKYLATYPDPAHERIQIVPSVVDIPITNPFDILLSIERSFGPWIAGQVTNSTFEINGLLVAKPSYIIEDHINGGVAVMNKQHHGLPIATWWVATVASFIGHFGNAENGGGWRVIDAASAFMEKLEPGSEKSLEDIYAQELIADRVVHVPGLPPHYEHEQMAQMLPMLLPLVFKMRQRWALVEHQGDIVVFTSFYEFEPAAAEASAKALTKPITPFCVGIAADLPPSDTPDVDFETSDPVLSFMNGAYTELGAHSVVYIAFGSHFFPPAQSSSHMKILIEEIIARGLRLVLSVKPEHAKASGLGDGYIEEITKTGNAIFPEWTQQLQVLEHPALHYFVTHGGWNSTTEAMGDQPANAMQLVRQYDSGFELMQVRTGPARSKAYRPDGDLLITGSDEVVREEVKNILKLSKGEKGKQQRLNIQALGKLARASNEAGGSADIALEKLGKSLGL
ncbi:hypothetical protein FRC07_000939, partial [Ceratobasidium sp. 392]